MLSARPITSRILRRLRNRSLTDDAFKKLEISPGTDWPTKIPLHLSGDDDRILRMFNNNTVDGDLAQSKSPFVNQGPTRAYCIRDVVVADGTLMTAKSFESIRDENRRMLLSGNIERYDERTFCSTSVTEKYWGHWLKDVFCHELLANEIGAAPLVLHNRNRIHEVGYRTIIGMPANSISMARIDKLWILEDYEINAARVERLNKIGSKLRAHHDVPGPSHVYLKRGVTGLGRKLLNEDEIVSALEARGFAILAPEQMEVDAIVASLRSAKLVVAVEGSAMSHATITMPRGGGLLVIEPPMRFNMLARTYCAALGLTMGYTVGDPGLGDDFSQPLDRLLKVVDMMDSEINAK